LTVVQRMHHRVLEAERILSGDALRAAEQAVTNATVAAQFDAWHQMLRPQLNDEALPPSERRCLKHFLHVTDNLRSHLICCYDQAGLPRTNNDMEGFIRAIKTRYRRISGRKNWNRYLLRYGRRVAYYEAEGGSERLGHAVRGLTPTQWRTARTEQRDCQADHLKQHRFRHHRSDYLHHLEARWAESATCT